MISPCATCEFCTMLHDCSDCDSYQDYCKEIVNLDYDTVRDSQLENLLDLNFPNQYGLFKLSRFYNVGLIRDYIPKWKNHYSKWCMNVYTTPWKTI